jgi:hypothetical protein
MACQHGGSFDTYIGSYFLLLKIVKKRLDNFDILSCFAVSQSALNEKARKSRRRFRASLDRMPKTVKMSRMLWMASNGRS